MALIHDTKTINGSQWGLKKKKKKPKPRFCSLPSPPSSTLRTSPPLSASLKSWPLHFLFSALTLTRYQLFLSLRWKMYCWVCLHLLIVCVFVCILSRPIRSAKSSMEVSSLMKKLRAYWKRKKDFSFPLLFTSRLSLFYSQIIISFHALSLAQFAIRSNPCKFFGQSLFLC